MAKIKNSKIALLGVFLLISIGCSQTKNKAVETTVSLDQKSISIESRDCGRITAILPGRGRYDGISLKFNPRTERWNLNFDHVPYRNEKPSPIGLLTLEEIAEISSLIINREGCANPAHATKFFKSGDRFMTSIDWWLIEDMYLTGLEAVRKITENHGGPMTNKPLNYPEVSDAFISKGFVEKFCNTFESPDHSCVKRGCDYSQDKTCEPEWGSTQKPYFSLKIKDLPMDEVCKIENCGLEKESPFNLELVKL